jgi:hypothetical protein
MKQQSLGAQTSGHRTRSMATTRLGFVGVGRMGSHMTSRLLDAGYALAARRATVTATAGSARVFVLQPPIEVRSWSCESRVSSNSTRKTFLQEFQALKGKRINRDKHFYVSKGIRQGPRLHGGREASPIAFGRNSGHGMGLARALGSGQNDIRHRTSLTFARCFA